ncbi:MAG TPA: signal peptidase II [Planctomycetota bacterium]
MKKHALVFSAVSLAGVVLDLLTKTWVLAAVPHHGERVLISGWLSFGHAYNEGTIWSFGPGAKVLWLILSVLAVPLIVGFFALRKTPTWVGTICLGMILAGAAGNGFDRIVYGAVRDFIMAYYTRADGTRAIWPLFNLADSFIVVGAILLALVPSPPAAARSEAKA